MNIVRKVFFIQGESDTAYSNSHSACSGEATNFSAIFSMVTYVMFP